MLSAAPLRELRFRTGVNPFKREIRFAVRSRRNSRLIRQAFRYRALKPVLFEDIHAISQRNAFDEAVFAIHFIPAQTPARAADLLIFVMDLQLVNWEEAKTRIVFRLSRISVKRSPIFGKARSTDCG
jgi:hypothetical protein